MAFLTVPAGLMTVFGRGEEVYLHGEWVRLNPGSRAFDVTRGVLSVACGVALIVPGLTGKATVLTPLAALALLVPAVAFPALRLRQGEIGPVFWFLGTIWLSFPPLFVAWARFGPYPL